jgi:formylglycine-generating enzyme required for sulfatase activity
MAACRGPKNNVYPYGNDYTKGACNEGRPSPMHTVFGPMGWGRHDDPRLAEAENTIEPGGSFPQCLSPYGNYDMHGNVHEWISDAAKPGDWRFGVFVGGYFADAQGNGFGCFYKTTAHVREYHDYSIGFRCCKEPKPSLEIELQ